MSRLQILVSGILNLPHRREPWTPPPIQIHTRESLRRKALQARHHVPGWKHRANGAAPEGPALVLLAGDQSGFATSTTWSTPSSQMAHPPRNRRHLREAVLPQALAPSLPAVRLSQVGFKAGGTTSSPCDRTAEAPPQKLKPLSGPPVHP